MIRLAMIRFRDGGSEVPVAIRRREEEDSMGCTLEAGSPVVEDAVRSKNSTGTLPHVNGPMKEAIADRPGCK